MNKYIESLYDTKSVYKDKIYEHLWFIPQDIPIPDCSLPQVTPTP